MSLIIQNISNKILHEISFEVQPSELFVIVGPTGAGKSSLLKTIVGLLTVEKGAIYLNEENITQKPPHSRHIAMLFQNHILFPQKNVQENIEFALKRTGTSSKESIAKTKNMAEVMGIAHLLKRYPDTLSGGEKQRVALAQILILDPKALLLDEPLTHLDPTSQKNLRQKIQQIHSTLAIPIVYITHNQMEALAIATKLGILVDGRIQHIAIPSEIEKNPLYLSIAEFLGIRPS